MNVDEKIALLMAAKAGSPIEVRFPMRDYWEDWRFGADTISFGLGEQWRVKVVPPKPREWVVAVMHEDPPQKAVAISYLFDSENHAKAWGCSGPFVRVREVL